MQQASELIERLDRSVKEGADRQTLDALFDALLDAYGALAEPERKVVREQYNRCRYWAIDAFYENHLSYLLRFRKAGELADLRRALGHYSISDGYPDARDAIVGLNDLANAAVAFDIEPAQLFAQVAAMSNPDGTWSLQKYILKYGGCLDELQQDDTTPDGLLRLAVYEPPEHAMDLVSVDPDVSEIAELVHRLAWEDITFVTLSSDDETWIEFSGSFADGFSARYAAQGSEHVIVRPPNSLEEGIQLLKLYLQDDERWLGDYEWE